jgi:hypothetical protein
VAFKTPFLPGISHLLRGSRARPAAGSVAGAAAQLDGLAAIVSRFIPPEMFAPKAGRRDRAFSPWVTFCAFLGQVLERGGSCGSAVRRVQAWTAATGRPVPSSATGAYCQARERLDAGLLREARRALGAWIEARIRMGDLWFGRRVKILDGCGLSMPDTARNRARWPYAGCQKPGCGFPTAKLVGLFCLASGRLIGYAAGSWKTHEIPLARQLLGWIREGDVVLADRGFCGWGLVAALASKGADVVMRAHQARRLAPGRVVLRKPQLPATWARSVWDRLPASVELRVVRFRIEARGFRTREVTLLTTLLDGTLHPDAAIAELYRQRWQVETCFRDIKTTLGLDVLRSRSPEMIEKEIAMQAFAYDLIRAVMLEAAVCHNQPPLRLSFAGALASIRHWERRFAGSRRPPVDELLRSASSRPVALRPDRSEPRVVKRRPKNYQLLTKRRRHMVVSTSRSSK